MEELPAELVHHIISLLAGDEHTLRNMSLTSSRFRQPSQRLLFSTLHLHCLRHGHKPSERLIKLLEAAPHIASYVEEFKIEDGFQSYMNNASWLTADLELHQALRLIPVERIKRLMIRLVWDILPIQTKTWISEVCGSPFLTSLTLLGGVSVSLLDLCQNSMKNLRIYDISPPHPAYESARTRTTPLELRTLRIDYHHTGSVLHFPINHLVDPVSNIDLSKLKRLAVLVTGAKPVGPILDQCTKSLEVFAMHMASENYNFGSGRTFDLSQFTNLRELVVCSDEYGSTTNVDPFVMVGETLRTITPQVPLQKIRLFFNAASVCHDMRPWRALNAVILESRRYDPSRLKDVEIELYFPKCKDPSARIHVAQRTFARLLVDSWGTGLVRLKATSTWYSPF
ncbi:hypothetical protein FA15DRAFT_758448 [Coprinopsis marcescibilis]|uniref:F-box domain-containing protein n=1 Tax=Coprinopsis marcescibilis TaxID=230819 RepID=A0A5C3KNR2_COPMA|nr:hypothetical protein FA15DRAFT_758448 [Coprinopsis marcescibilis]